MNGLNDQYFDYIQTQVKSGFPQEKETPTQVFSSEIYEKFKNTFFHRAILVAAS